MTVIVPYDYKGFCRENTGSSMFLPLETRVDPLTKLKKGT